MGAGSADVDREGNFSKSLVAAPKYMMLILEVARLAADDPELNNQQMEDFSLKKKLLE